MKDKYIIFIALLVYLLPLFSGGGDEICHFKLIYVSGGENTATAIEGQPLKTTILDGEGKMRVIHDKQRLIITVKKYADILVKLIRTNIGNFELFIIISKETSTPSFPAPANGQWLRAKNVQIKKEEELKFTMHLDEFAKATEIRFFVAGSIDDKPDGALRSSSIVQNGSRFNTFRLPGLYEKIAGVGIWDTIGESYRFQIMAGGGLLRGKFDLQNGDTIFIQSEKANQVNFIPCLLVPEDFEPTSVVGSTLKMWERVDTVQYWTPDTGLLTFKGLIKLEQGHV